MKGFYLTLMLFLLAGHTPQTLCAAELYAFFVGDFHSLDIQQASRTDLKNMHEEAQRIAKYGNYKLKASFYAEEKKTGSKLLKALKKLAPQKEDMVLFYFSGHGYRPSKGYKNAWPYLDFPSEKHGMSYNDVINHIANLNPGFTLLIADCCNWTIPYGLGNPPLLKGCIPKSASEKQVKKNYKKLFCDSKGVIAIAGAQAGQASYCKSYGSFYTLSFLTGLHEVIQRQTDVSWQSILSIAENNLTDRLLPYNLKQTPVVLCIWK